VKLDQLPCEGQPHPEPAFAAIEASIALDECLEYAR
jgi:hypothetical protein